ncbi:hypothetical protein [Francisella sp. SYW-9]|uniref:hypothetical protein n=1 Tax=Francisella sp. SYW-9 TaxID=2610888 RepID=UPI00123D0C65|nr:hypothetical protein [Francisella sp. SYW-9]
MKIKNRQNKKSLIDEFINSADSNHVTDINDNKIIKNTKKYKRVTFSLDEETKDIIESLSIKSNYYKTSNSDIVKIAIRYLNDLTNADLEIIIKKYK